MKIVKLTALIVVMSTHIANSQSTIILGQGNVKNVSVSSSAAANNGLNTLQLGGFLPNSNSSSRFLSQATLGHNFVSIQEVEQLGAEKWLDNQLNTSNVFKVQTYLAGLHQSMVDSLNAKGVTPVATLANTNVGDYHFDISWFQGSMTSPEVLRWRVALALSEIFVTSRNSTFKDNPYALASYYDLLLENSFGNYRTIIDKISYHPTMGVYLTFMNNHATDAGKQIYPDENYAREIMQLFSIGLYKLNIDGTEMKDANNKSIPTYNNNDIANLAKVFTGLSWGDSRYLGDNSKNNWSYTLRMKFFPLDSSDAKKNTWKTSPRIVDGHEGGTKTFLGQTIVARPVQQGELDIQDALNIIFNHQNVPPFIARRLIQRLTTSNPSAGYIQRVASVFVNNGAGVRGDLKAVIKAILLDYEARDCCAAKTNTAAGMLREPFVRYMNIMKGLPLTTTGGVIRNVMYDHYDRLEQIPMYAQTVFNFFQPDYQPNGDLKDAKKYGPEFQLLSSQTLTGYMNALQRWIVDDNPTDYWGLFNGEVYKKDQDPGFNLTSDYLLTRDDRLPELLDKYNLLFAHGSISPQIIGFIKNAIMQLPYSEVSGVPNTTEAYRRQRLALYLILSSPDYLINR